MSNDLVRLAVVGAGLIGARHARLIRSCVGVQLVAIVDPSDVAQEIANELKVSHYKDLEILFRENEVEGIILATPNQLHVQQGLYCLERGCPVLIEKPIAVTSQEALALVEMSKSSALPVLVGHHRRYVPEIQQAHALIEQKALGVLKVLHMNCWFYKPDSYFQVASWRSQRGVGPLGINLVHDIDLALYLCGSVLSVNAYAAPSNRSAHVEDSAVIILRFNSGVLATMSLSDTVVAPWSWELTAHENPAYPPTQESAYFLGGTHASLSLPDLTLWRNEQERSWWEPLQAVSQPREIALPLLKQIQHFADLIRGTEKVPIVSAEEGLMTLQVLEAIQCSINEKREVILTPVPSE